MSNLLISSCVFFISGIYIFPSRSLVWVFVVCISFLTMLMPSCFLLSTQSIFVIEIWTFLSTVLSSMSFLGLFLFVYSPPVTIGHGRNFLPLCMSAQFWFGTRHSELYVVRCWNFLYSFKNFLALFSEAIQLDLVWSFQGLVLSLHLFIYLCLSFCRQPLV